MLAYVCDSTAAPLCVLVPITTWSVFCGRILVKNGWQVGDASEIEMFVKTIPYNFYAWIAVLIVPLVIIGVVPKIFGMKKAYQRVADGGPLAPPGSEKISILASDHEGGQMNIPEKPRMFNFFIGVEFHEMWTRPNRNYVFFEGSTADMPYKFSGLVGFKAGWNIPLYERKTTTTFYYR